MKQFFEDIPNKWKAVYLGWVFLHFILFLTSSLFEYHRSFYPFHWWEIKFDVDYYDYSEFLIYTLAPIVIYLVVKLWKKSDG